MVVKLKAVKVSKGIFFKNKSQKKIVTSFHRGATAQGTIVLADV